MNTPPDTEGPGAPDSSDARENAHATLRGGAGRSGSTGLAGSTSGLAAADPGREWWSALADGQADAAELERAPEQWAADAGLRRAWHDYHLIGDVLRSGELAQAPAHDEAFLRTLRQRLDAEPVVLAPAALPGGAHAAARRRALQWRRWTMPLTAAAGVAAVAAVLVATRDAAPGAAPDGGAPVLAGASAPGLERASIDTASPGPLVVDGQLIRDARIDAYLRAHRDARGPGAAAVPGGGVRNVEFLAPQR